MSTHSVRNKVAVDCAVARKHWIPKYGRTGGLCASEAKLLANVNCFPVVAYPDNGEFASSALNYFTFAADPKGHSAGTD